MAKGGALQTGRLRGKGLRLKLKGVTKGASSQAVERLDSDPEGGFERDVRVLYELADSWHRQEHFYSRVPADNSSLH